MAKTETPAVPSINLNGKTYPIADLSATAKAQLLVGSKGHPR